MLGEDDLEYEGDYGEEWEDDYGDEDVDVSELNLNFL